MLTTTIEDQRSIANRLAAEEKKGEEGDDKETAMSKKDSTLPVRKLRTRRIFSMASSRKQEH